MKTHTHDEIHDRRIQGDATELKMKILSVNVQFPRGLKVMELMPGSSAVVGGWHTQKGEHAVLLGNVMMGPGSKLILEPGAGITNGADVPITISAADTR